MPIITVKTEAELTEALAKAPGAVALEFYATGCQPCTKEAPKLAKIAEKNPTLTIIKADVDEAGALADKWGIEEMPTLYFAEKGDGLKPDTATELTDARELAKTLKR